MRYCWEDLANAIVLRAVEDYRLAQKQKRLPDKRKAAQARIRELERFFCSKWFAQLTDVDGKTLLNQLKGDKTA